MEMEEVNQYLSSSHYTLEIRHKIQNVTERIVFTVFGYGFWKKQPRKTLVSSRVKMWHTKNIIAFINVTQWVLFFFYFAFRLYIVVLLFRFAFPFSWWITGCFLHVLITVLSVSYSSWCAVTLFKRNGNEYWLALITVQM